ncbi:hypothetical protein AB0C29_21275 [Actinoplanes sp. NPDC048791]|uniref:hypothetical protein n=1 Tax=Actinoplanes sp. NPDC048791 TaxID=3154623 RepID=UPI00340BEF0F
MTGTTCGPSCTTVTMLPSLLSGPGLKRGSPLLTWRRSATQREVADLMGVTARRDSEIEDGDLDANQVARLSRYARALAAWMRIA